jgi:hypothetical protein
MNALGLRWLASLNYSIVPARRRTTHARRSARAALAAGLVAIVLAHLGLAAAVETKRPQWRDPEYFHRQKRLQAVVKWEREQGHARPLLVIIGGSRPQMGLSPEHLGLGSGPTDPLVFALVQSGTIPIGERLNLARLFASGVTPDYVLIEVLPPVLADPGPMDGRIPLMRLGAADLARIRPYQTDPERVHFQWLRNRAESWYSLRVPLAANWRLSAIAPPGPNRSDFLWSEMKFFGWSPFYPAEWPESRREAGLAAAQGPYKRLLDHFSIESVNDRLYRDMLADCRDRGVQAALFMMPESPVFRGWYPPGVREQIADYLAVLSREFSVPVFDGSTWENDERAYMDGHHLLGPAAEAFSKRFGRECVAPWLRGGRP